MSSAIGLKIQANVPLGPLTTLKVGGPARFFVEARLEEEVRSALHHAASTGLDVFILGGGSNLLVSDRGFDGLAICVAIEGIAVKDDAEGRVLVTARAGEDWERFVKFCVDRDLAGVECLSGIPGLVGGTPVQNVGAYGQDVSGTIVSVRCIDRISGEICELAAGECGFGYRTSIFNSSRKDRYVVTAVTFALVPGGAPTVTYKDLKEVFAGKEPTLAEIREAVLRIRSAKSMVIDEADPNSQSAGSFFKNPIVSRSKLAEIESVCSPTVVPHFGAGPELVKIPAAWLIEQAGFQKGFAIGNAGISENHSLAIINRGGASAAEILTLVDQIVDAVAAKFGIKLVPEPVMLGFAPAADA